MKILFPEENKECHAEYAGGPYYGAAISCSYEDANGAIWVTNGEYASRVNYCPFTGKKAKKPITPRG